MGTRHLGTVCVEKAVEMELVDSPLWFFLACDVLESKW